MNLVASLTFSRLICPFQTAVMKFFEFGPAGGAGGVGGGKVGADCGDLGGGLRLTALAGDGPEVFTEWIHLTRLVIAMIRA